MRWAMRAQNRTALVASHIQRDGRRAHQNTQHKDHNQEFDQRKTAGSADFMLRASIDTLDSPRCRKLKLRKPDIGSVTLAAFDTIRTQTRQFDPAIMFSYR